jgi:hypothetical protein
MRPRPLRDRHRQRSLADPNVECALVVLTPQTMTQIPETAEALGTISKKYGKPCSARSWATWPSAMA